MNEFRHHLQVTTTYSDGHIRRELLIGTDEDLAEECAKFLKGHYRNSYSKLSKIELVIIEPTMIFETPR